MILRNFLGNCPVGAQADILQVEQTKLLYAGLPAAIVINTLLALILVGVQRPVITPNTLYSWLAMIGTILLTRVVLMIFWRRSGMDAANYDPCWIRRFRFSAIATGMAWGMGAALLFPAGDVTHQVYLAFVLAGLCAGAISSLAVDRTSTLGFLVSALVPLIVRFGMEGGTASLSMSAMVTLFVFFVAANAARVGRSLHENIRLRIQAEEQEQRLRDSEERLNQAQRTAHIGNWELDLVSNRLYWSDEVYRIFEIDRSKVEPSYEAFINVIHTEDREAVNLAYTSSLETREPYEITHRILTRDGRIKWVAEQCKSFFDRKGKPIRSIGTVQDITERKQVEEERERQIRNLHALLNAIQETTFLMDKNGMILVINGVGAQRLNAKPEDLVGCVALHMQ